jgi:hypothetical protein
MLLPGDLFGVPPPFRRSAGRTDDEAYLDHNFDHDRPDRLPSQRRQHRRRCEVGCSGHCTERLFQLRRPISNAAAGTSVINGGQPTEEGNWQVWLTTGSFRFTCTVTPGGTIIDFELAKQYFPRSTSEYGYTLLHRNDEVEI